MHKKKAANLISFHYIGHDSSGNTIKGESRGKSIDAVRAHLKEQGITAKKIYKTRAALFKRSSIKSSEITILTRQLATLLSSGVPLIQSLDVCMNANDNIMITNMLNQIKSSVERGHSLSEALSLYPEQFNSLYRNLIAVGEESGNLDTMLVRLADHQEKLDKLKSKFKKTLIYPVTIILVAVLVTLILLIYVVPQFESMFANFNAELPWFTKMVLAVSRWLQAYWYYLLFAILITSYLLHKYLFKNNKTKLLIDTFILSVPIIGKIINKICLARFARTLNTMLTSGIPLLNAIPAVSAVVNNEIYTIAINKVKQNIENGQPFNMAMQRSHCFNNMIIQMVSIGENSGTLDKMLLKIAELYEEQIDNTVDNLSSILEPIIILILSVIVGSLIVAMYLPIFTLGTVI